MKKIFISIIMLLLFVSTNVYAGDIPESIMLGKQKALFIGEITTINKDTYSIIPSTVMMGSMQKSEIQIKKIDKYYGTNNKPKVGDFIVAVLLDKNKIDDTWVFKSTSDDYRTLKLVSQSYNMVVRYEKYINEGKYFEAQKKINKDNRISEINTTWENFLDSYLKENPDVKNYNPRKDINKYRKVRVVKTEYPNGLESKAGFYSFALITNVYDKITNELLTSVGAYKNNKK